MCKILGTAQQADKRLLVGNCCLVQIHLPIHQAARSEVVLNRIDAFLFNHQSVVDDVEHLDDACRADVSFGNTREERVAAQVVEPVHVELRGDELVKESLRVVVFEDFDGQREASLHLAVHLFHHHERNLLV